MGGGGGRDWVESTSMLFNQLAFNYGNCSNQSPYHQPRSLSIWWLSRIISYDHVLTSVYGLANSCKQGQFIVCFIRTKTFTEDKNSTRHRNKFLWSFTIYCVFQWRKQTLSMLKGSVKPQRKEAHGSSIQAFKRRKRLAQCISSLIRFSQSKIL